MFLLFYNISTIGYYATNMCAAHEAKKYLKFTSSVLRHKRRQPCKQITVEGRVRKQLKSSKNCAIAGKRFHTKRTGGNRVCLSR